MACLDMGRGIVLIGAHFTVILCYFGSTFDCKFMASMAILVGKMMINPGLAPSFSQTHIRLCCRSDGKFTLCKFFGSHLHRVRVFSFSEQIGRVDTFRDWNQTPVQKLVRLCWWISESSYFVCIYCMYIYIFICIYIYMSNWQNYCNTNLVLLRLGLSEVAQNLQNR